MTISILPARSDPTPSSAVGMVDALDQLEDAAEDAGVLSADVVLQLELCRHLVAITSSIRLGDQPTVAEVYALRELRIATTELRQLVVERASTRRRR